MPCKIKINKNLVSKVQLMSNDALNKPLIEANKIADDINKKFRTPVVSFMKTSSGKLERSIFIPQSLIDTYYKHELSIEKQETKSPLVDINKLHLTPEQASLRFLNALNFTTMFNADEFIKSQTAEKVKNSEMIISATDVMQKFVAIAKDKEAIELPKQAAYIMYEMLGRKNILTKDLWFNIEQWSKFQEVYDKYKNDYVEDKLEDHIDITAEDVKEFEDQITSNKNPFAKKMAIVALLQEMLESYGELGITPKTKRISEDVTKEYFEKRGYRNIYEKNLIIKFINQVLNWINENIFNNERFEKYDESKLEDLALDIIDDVYREDYDKFTRGYSKVGDQIITPKGDVLVLKNYEESVTADPKAAAIMDTLLNKIYVNRDKSIGPKLSGSAATRKYGKTYRSVDEAFHDFDIVIPLSMHELEANYAQILNIIENNVNNLSPKVINSLVIPLIKQQSWYINLKNMYPNWTLLNAFVGRDHKKGESVTVTGVIDGQFKNGKYVKDTGTIVDFFVRVKESEDSKEEFDNYWKTWKGIYEAKLKMGRLKDLTDFIYFDPFIKDQYKFTNKGYRYFSYAENKKSTAVNDIDTLELDMNNLNLTPEVVNYLYGESSNRLSKENFAIQSKELISILQGANLTNQEILEKLKCL
jgi:hypothetical protein